MSINWPRDLVESLVQRRAIVVLGSGASASCKAPDGSTPPTWRSLLEILCEELPGRLEPNKDRQAAEDLIEAGRYLDAAQIIVDRIPAPQRETVLTGLFNDPKIKPSKLFEYVALIDQPIVITTNYDRLYERYWDSMLENSIDSTDPAALYVSKYYDNDIVDHLRSARQTLLKVHGDISQVGQVVLSRSQYFRAKYEHVNFFKVVSALFLTRTVLFIGCGFNGDPDIELLLEDSSFTAQSVWPHYAVVPSGRHPSELSSIRNSFNVECLEYETTQGDHSELLESLRDLADLVVNGRG